MIGTKANIMRLSRSRLLAASALRLAGFALIGALAAAADRGDKAAGAKVSGEELLARTAGKQSEARLAEMAAGCSTAEEWQSRAAAIRRGILRGAGLDPLPAKGPLNAAIRDRKERDGYTIENVAFESLPGFYVTGNLYRPLGREGKVPAILNPHGHFDDHGFSGRTRPDMQSRCAQFARMGAVAFAYDMVGRGESAQMPHKEAFALTMQLWNSIRSVDFLLTLPEVDATRIGVTGASGGGTQTFLLAAVDDRIAASAPVVMVSAHFQGGCKCESGMPIRSNPQTNNVEIAACAAPRPQLIVSDGSDWTHNFPGVEFPYIWKVYRLFGEEKNVENAHLPFDKHDYGYSKRAPVYEFFARHFALQRIGVNPMGGADPPEGIPIEKHESLLAFGAEHPRPATALQGVEAIKAALKAAQGEAR